MIDRGNRVYVETYGCQMNVYDSRAIAEALSQHGYREVARPEDADLLLLNTCAVRDHAETRVLGRIGQLQSLKRERPDLVFGVVGCMAQRLGKQLMDKRAAVDLVVGTDNYHRIAELVEGFRADGAPRSDVSADGLTTYQAGPESDPHNNTHFISITRGCDYRCTFCVVPATRGVLRAKHPHEVLREVRAVVQSGGVEITLLGQNVTAYRHADASFAQLLTMIAQEPGVRRVRFLTSHPTDFPDETLRAIADNPQVCPWLHMPVQSGSDRMLRRMKRGHKRAHYMEVVEKARALLPDVSFSTDIIVGFPGETPEDFEATLDIMREVRYDSAFTFKYSPRPDTPAAKLEDDVSEDTKRARLAEVNALQEELWEERARNLLGTRVEVAIEGQDVKGQGYLRARTPNNRKVLIPTRPKLGVGDELLVRLTGVKATTFFAQPVGLLWRYQSVAA
jgi:tRNA-2-methylthio-N6-dimethylallyladenosine synthase